MFGGTCGSAGAVRSLLPVLEHVLAQLDPADVACLRLTAKVFRHHPAVLRSCQNASPPTVGTTREFKHGLGFLQLLPCLQNLILTGCRTLFGVEKVTQLLSVTIHGTLQQPLDLFPLSLLPSMQDLGIFDCLAERLANLSELTPLSSLAISQPAVHAELSLLTNLEVLRIPRQPSLVADVFNWPTYQSLSKVTSLTDNGLCSGHVHSMTQLQSLELTSFYPGLGTLPLMVGLRALGLNLSGPEHSLAATGGLQPLTSLTRLERLQLTGLPLPIPALPALQELILAYEHFDSTFPPVATPNVLTSLHLRPCGVLKLPNLAQFPDLLVIFLVDDAGELYTSPRQAPYMIKSMDHLRQLDSFLETV